MEHILDIITINPVENRQHQIILYANSPFRICDVELPQCNTGFVYMLILTKQRGYIDIGKTKCMQTRQNQNNSGHRYTHPELSYLRLFAINACICGIDNDNQLMLLIKERWKQRVHELNVRHNIANVQVFSQAGQDVIANIAHNCLDSSDEIKFYLVINFKE